MKAFTITDIKAFTSGLFSGEIFDSFLLMEAEFHTDFDISMDGHINKGYFDTEEKPAEGYVAWGQKKGIAFQIIKGKRLPLSFRIVLCMTEKNKESTLLFAHTNYSLQDVENFYLNINYKSGRLTMTSGMSMNIFTMDKSLPEYWDKLAEKFLKQNNISYE